MRSMMRMRVIAALLLAVAVVLQTTAMGVARAHETTRFYGLASGCHAASNVDQRSDAPQSGEHRDCLLCQQCAADASFDEILPLQRDPLVQRFAAKRVVVWIPSVRATTPEIGRSQLPRAPPQA